MHSIKHFQITLENTGSYFLQFPEDKEKNT